MTNFLPLIWKKHRRRDDLDECPHCSAKLKWIYDGFDWFPCDHEPVLFVMYPGGKHTLIYQNKELDNCLLYDKDDARCKTQPLWAYQQHYYTCKVLRERRRELARRRAVYEGNV